MLYELPDHIEHHFVDRGSRVLVVVCSPNLKFALLNTDFRHSTLYLVDTETTYYTLRADESAGAIADFARENRFKSVIFLGGSKGGYGALLLAALLSRLSSHLRVAAIGFSAQTKLYPLNKALYFPSYRSFLNRAARKPPLMADLERFGDLRRLVECSAKITLIYGERDPVDAWEAARVSGPNVRKMPIPISFHGSMVPFVLDRSDEDDLIRKVRGIYAGARGAPEALAALPDDPEVLVDQLRNMHLPTLQDLVKRECRHIPSLSSVIGLFKNVVGGVALWSAGLALVSDFAL